MTDAIIVAVTASLVREYLRRNVRLTSWLLILAAESMQTVATTLYQNVSAKIPLGLVSSTKASIHNNK